MEPKYTIEQGFEGWVLTATTTCRGCCGSGEVREPHGETLPCDCVWDSVTDEVMDQIDAGIPYRIDPDPFWVKAMQDRP